MYQQDTILSLKVPKWRPVIDGEPGDWTHEDYDEFKTEFDEYLEELTAHQAITAGLRRSQNAPASPTPPDGELFPYNEVRVIGPSPILHSGGEAAQWSGGGAAGVIIVPTASFGATLDEPLGKLQALYDVVSVPERIIHQPTIRVVDSATDEAGPTPEDVFAEKAPGVPPLEGQTRGRTPISPLEDTRPPANASPLG